MNPYLIPTAAMCGLVVASLAASFFALVRARALAEGAEGRARAARQEQESALSEMRRRVEAVASQVDELAAQPAPVPAAGPVRSGLNLSKRSLALRMHRRGDPAQQIASSLEIPLQELELLLKVHQIVMRSI